MTTIALLVFLVLRLTPCCNGEHTLYVQSHNNTTGCPRDASNCKLLSEYATDFQTHPILETNTTVVFLPGLHILDKALPLIGSVDFNLESLDPEQSTTIFCSENGSFTFANFTNVALDYLGFSSCSFQVTQVELTVIRHCQFTDGSKTVLQVLYGSTVVENTVFEDNTSPTMFLVLNSSLSFRGNQLTNNSGIMMSLAYTDVNFTDSSFTNNDNRRSVGVVVTYGMIMFSGTNTVVGNFGVFSGFMYAFNCTIVMDGNATFVNNTGLLGGMLSGILIDVSMRGYAYFIHNTCATGGGAISAQESHFDITGEVEFLHNTANFGGTLYLVASSISFIGEANITFSRNFANNGGGVFLASGSTLNFHSSHSGTITFEDNYAQARGGAVFIQDFNTQIYCTLAEGQTQLAPVQTCSFQFSGSERNDTSLVFRGNHAVEAGSVIYGGAIGLCSPYHGFHPADPFVLGAVFDNHTNDNINSSLVSSVPHIVYVCDGNVHECTNCSVSYSVYPGASLEVTVASLGQQNGPVPATVQAIENDLTIQDLEVNQEVSRDCTVLTYTINGMPGNASLELYAEGPCLTLGSGLVLEIEILDCPPGFTLTTTGVNNASCTCDPRLLEYTDLCDSQNGTITRDENFWVGYDRELAGLILYPTCPFDYCTSEEVSLKVQYSDAQCNHNRAGLLCGECFEGLSLLLGSSKCDKCSNDYLALLLFFAAAGLMLVTLLLLLNLTVAVGTINGLIFFANIISANDTLVFPPNSNTYLHILRAFIAWINLDFGIESCFYDGMDVYAHMWLQYAFPIYILFLIGIVFLITHFSSRVSWILGDYPVSVFATLILLSYTKLLRTIIEAFSSASLNYPEGESRLVWLRDGNLPFRDDRHQVLFLFSLVVLLLLFIPYTLLLLTSQWLQAKSHWKVLSWVNNHRLKSFLDAYHAPYKPEHRYWTGILLLVRFALLLTSTAYPDLTFIVMQTLMFLVQTWAWIVGGVYSEWYLNVLEAFFYFNLGVLAASSYYVSSEFDSMSSEAKRSQGAVSGTLITAAFIAFIGIIIFHIKKGFHKGIMKSRHRLSENNVAPVPERPEVRLQSPTVTRSILSISVLMNANTLERH